MPTKPVEPPEILGNNRSDERSGTGRNDRQGSRSDRSAALQSGTVTNRPEFNPWLAQKITTNRRQAHPDTCRKCGVNILVGPDHDRVAGTARVDPEPVDEINEVVALLLGRFSYDLIGQELDLRDQWRHHSPRRHPVLLEHRCT